MQLFSIEGNTQRLDGGAMFGNCPRALWERWCPPDERNRILLACRALLIVEDDGRNVLLDAGVGSPFPAKLSERYGVPHGEHRLLRSLAEVGVTPEEVDVIVLSHLHFDHAAGVLEPWVEGAEARLAFPRARIIVSQAAWDRARNPHVRDRASFLPGLCEVIEASGRLARLADGAERSPLLGDGYRFSCSAGHTPGLLLTRVLTGHGPVTFAGDLVPGVPWIHLPITVGYDRYPELVVDEKREMFEGVMRENGWVFFAHDPRVAACRIGRDEQGRYRAVEELAAVRW